ncbi:MAG: efflux RND transporter permease subunit, partial [Clostridiales bacterium]|nr:efflux RND transporter permease subunit [Clostridiales bacterium]
MKTLLKKLINNRKITLLFVAVIVITGVFSYYISPKQESPDFSVPYAFITTVYPGANQEDVDTYITSKIEERLKRIDGYNTSNSYSSSNLSLVIMELDVNADRDEAFDQLQEHMTALQSELPEQALKIDINTNITNETEVILSLSSDNYTHEELNVYASELSRDLSNIAGVNKFETKGHINQEVIIEVDQEKLSLLGISLNDVVNIVKFNNIDIPMGKIGDGNEKISIEVDETYKNIEDIEDTIVGFNNQTNTMITLKDVSEIYSAQKANDTYYIVDNSNTVLVVGYFDEQQNILLVGDDIRQEIEQFEKELPSDIQIKELLFQPEEVEDSIGVFMQNLLISVILVILVVLIGMGFRNAIIVSVSIPLSILIAFSMMRVFNIVIHQISIAALIISLGMLVDNAIVISDSIQGYIDDGNKKLKACIDGTREVAVPVLTSTLTTIAAFAPFLFLTSIAGDYIKALPQIVIVTLAASYLVAVLIIPVFAFIFFKPKKKSNKKFPVKKAFLKILKKGMKAKWVVVLIIVIALVVTGYLAYDIDKIFFPTSDKDIIYIDITNNSSDNIDSTANIAGEVSIILENEECIEYYVTAIGGGVPRFNRILLIYSARADVSQIMIRVNLDESSYDTNGELVDHLQRRIDERNLDAKIAVKQLMYAFPTDKDIEVRVVGDDINIVKQHESE